MKNKFPIANFHFPMKFELINYQLNNLKLIGDWRQETGN